MRPNQIRLIQSVFASQRGGVAVALVLPPATIGGRWLYRADAQNFVIALNVPQVH